jgi:hypothetical protein
MYSRSTSALAVSTPIIKNRASSRTMATGLARARIDQDYSCPKKSHSGSFTDTVEGLLYALHLWKSSLSQP